VPIRVLPVLDLRSGKAVHALGGRRATYRVVSSVLCAGADPFDLALAFRNVLGLDQFYLADLDAISGGAIDAGFLRRASAAGLRAWVDAGVRDASSLDPLFQDGADTVIVATETLLGPTELVEIQRVARPGSVVFGLDLKGGQPVLAPDASWRSTDPLDLIDAALATGIDRVLILDTTRVGSGEGVGTLPLVLELLRHSPDSEVTVGGGIAGLGELTALADLGVSAALVGSALHDGRIGPEDLRDLSRRVTSPVPTPPRPTGRSSPPPRPG
jgi:phosphoribosylformimino-5-aminoimidazole carboxamide ribotide isomerase